MATPTLAAVTLSETGGGVAAVSRLIWDVMGDTWGDQRQLITLDPTGDDGRPGVLRRLAFGARLASHQAGHADSWILFTHLALARAQAYLPLVTRRPYAVFLHGIEAWRPLRSVERAVLAGAALRIANSQFTARQIALANPGLGSIESCALALPPASRARRSPLDPTLADRMGPEAVLLVGRMVAGERYKGHDELLDVWPAVVAARPNARLVFAGDGNDRARMQTRARTLGVADRVVFTGFVSDADLDQLYRSARLFAMPSRGEGFGIVYLEAMAHGLPCIGSIHDAASEIIEHGVTGYLVDQSNARHLASQLTYLLSDREACQRMGHAGQRRVAERFTYARFSSQLVSLLQQAVGRTAPALMAEARGID